MRTTPAAVATAVRWPEPRAENVAYIVQNWNYLMSLPLIDLREPLQPDADQGP